MDLIKTFEIKKAILKVYQTNDLNRMIKTYIKDYLKIYIMKQEVDNIEIYNFKNDKKIIYITKINTEYKIRVYDKENIELYFHSMIINDKPHFLTILLTKIINV
jgi:hypothetical protein